MDSLWKNADRFAEGEQALEEGPCLHPKTSVIVIKARGTKLRHEVCRSCEVVVSTNA